MKPALINLNAALALGIGLTMTVWLLFQPLTQAAQPLIPTIGLANPTVRPPSNSYTHSLTASVSLQYNQPLSPATVTSQTVALRATQSDHRQLTYQINGQEIRLVPGQPFKASELIQVTATTGTMSLAGERPTRPTVWQFWTATISSSGLLADSGQQLGNAGSRAVILGDVDGDGDLDALVANPATAGKANHLWLNNGEGYFSQSSQILGYGDSQTIALGDVDGDGDLDALIANADESNQLWFNNGSGQFSNSGQSLGPSYDLALGDMDGDGDLDVLTSHTIWLNDGAGYFGSLSPSTIINQLADIAVTIGDLDNDGDLDVVAGNSPNQTTKIWLNGEGEFYATSQHLGSLVSQEIALGDVDQDSDLDVLLTYGTTQTSHLWLNSGSGSFTQSSQLLAKAIAADLKDMDGDGDLDIFFITREGQANQIWLNQGAGEFIDSGQEIGPADSSQVALGDMDDDGDVDAFIINVSQPSQVWLNDEPAILTMSQTNGVTQAYRGQTLTYTLSLSNIGHSAATGLVIVDTLPPRTKFITASNDGFLSNETVIWFIDRLAPHQQQQLTLTVEVDKPLPSTISSLTNMVTAVGQDQQGNRLAVSHSLTTSLNNPSPPRLTIDLTGPATATLNSQVIYSFQVRHTDLTSSTIPISNVVVSHTLASQLLTTPVAGDDNENGLLDPTETWLYRDSYRVPSDQYNGSLTNQATVSGVDTEYGELVSGDLSANHTVTIIYQPVLELIIQKKFGLPTPQVGQPFYYEFFIRHATNSDYSPVNQLVLTDTLNGQVDCPANRIYGSPAIICQASYLIQPTDSIPLIIGGQISGVDQAGRPVTASDVLVVDYINFEPALNLTLDGPSSAQIGDTIIYHFTLSHAPTSDQSPISQLKLSHSLTNPIQFVGGDDGDAVLEINESWLYTASYQLKAPADGSDQLVNIAQVVGQDTTGQKVQSSAIHWLIINQPVITPIEEVILSGPNTGVISQVYTFRATVSPTTIDEPLTFHWQATNQTDVIQTGRGVNDFLDFRWLSSGLKTITVTVSDGTTTAVGRYTITIIVPNQSPTVSKVQIRPTAPDDDTTLQVSYVYSDPDGDLEGQTQIRWLANDSLQSSLNNRSLVPADLTQAGDIWCARVTPYDSRGAGGATIEADCVTIEAATICEVANLQLAPGDISPDEQDLRLTYELTCDTAQPAEANIRWYRDGRLQPGLNGQTVVSAAVTLPSEAWAATVTPCLPDLCEATIESNTVYIDQQPNMLPVATVAISPVTPRDRDNLHLIYEIDDPDGNPARQANLSRIRWYQRGALQPAFSNQTSISATQTYEGQVWCVTVQPHDGFDYGPESEPFCVAIGNEANHPPQALNVSLGADRQPSGSTLELTYQYADQDGDKEAIANPEIRWYRQGVLQPAFNGQTYVPGYVVTAGDQWSVTIRPHDGQNYGVTVTAPPVNIVAAEQNTPPTVSQVRLWPPSETTQGHLSLQYDYHDVDGDLEGDTLIYWYNNPLTRTEKFDGLTKIPASELRPGEVWYARVIPHDGLDYGEPVAAHSIRTVGRQTTNSPPSVRLLLTPKNPGVEQNIELLYVYEDPDGDLQGDTIINWTLNGLPQSLFTGKTIIPADLTKEQDEWCVDVTPVDMPGMSGEMQTACVTVGDKPNNTPPVVEGQSFISPATPLDGDNIHLNYNYFDADGDPEQDSLIRWYKIITDDDQTGQLQTGFNNLKFIPATATTPGDRWYATILVHDGQDYSDILKTTPMVMVNHPPTARNLQINPDEARANQRIRIQYDFIDPDGHVESEPEIRWYLDGDLQAAYNDNPIFPEQVTQEGQILTVTVKPHDGFEYGEMITTAVTIGPPKSPTPIYLPLLTKTQPPVTVTPTPTSTPTMTPTPVPPCSPAGRYEPNNRYDEACPIELNQKIIGSYPDDMNDVFSFILTENSSITVKVTNYAAYHPYGQLVVYDSFDREKDIGRDPYLHGEGTVPNRFFPNALQDLSPGRYYVQIYTCEGAFNANEAYSLEVIVGQENLSFSGTLRPSEGNVCDD